MRRRTWLEVYAMVGKKTDTNSRTRSTQENADILHRLAGRLNGRVCVFGIGNRQRGDDGVGSVIAERLSATVEQTVVDGGVAPENHLEKVVRSEPDTVLVIDAADFGGAPGELNLLDWHRAEKTDLSSHGSSLCMLGTYLTARTGANLEVLAVQPADIKLGNSLSPPVSEAAERVQAFIQSRGRSGQPPGLP